jgi:hypothetical protein
MHLVERSTEYLVAGGAIHKIMQEVPMKVIGLAALIAITSVPVTHAGSTHLVQGLSCRTVAQMDAAVALIRRDVPPPDAMRLLNTEEVVCVLADRIWYVIDDPVMIGQSEHRGRSLLNYEAMLVGVVVGKNARPVEPPLRLYFVLPKRLPGVPETGGA